MMTPDNSDISNDLDYLYQEVVMDHYRKPRNSVEVLDPDVTSRGFNPFCGDEVVLGLKLTKDGKITSVGCTGQGCSISQASASILTELVQGKSLNEATYISQVFRCLLQGKTLSNMESEQIGELVALQGVRKFPIRIKCALLAWAALDDGIRAYEAGSKETDGTT